MVINVIISEASMSYRITDGHETEDVDTLSEAAEIAADWYDWLFDENEIDPIEADLDNESLDALNASISAWLEKIAEAIGHTVFQGHGNYCVSAASEAGLHLVVLEVRDE